MAAEIPCRLSAFAHARSSALASFFLVRSAASCAARRASSGSANVPAPSAMRASRRAAAIRTRARVTSGAIGDLSAPEVCDPEATATQPSCVGPRQRGIQKCHLGVQIPYRRSRPSGREAIADARIGPYVARTVRRLDLAAQIGDLPTQHLRLVAVCLSPNRDQQIAVGHQAAAVARKRS